MPPGRVTVLDADALAELTPDQLRDATAATEPDAFVATSASTRIGLRAALDVDVPVLCPEAERDADEPTVRRAGDAELVVAGSDGALGALPTLESAREIDPTTETYVLTDRLDLSIRPTELSTVREGFDGYVRAIAVGQRDAGRVLDGSYTHLSTELPAGYYGEWDGLTVRGVAPGELDGTPDGGAGGSEPGVAGLALGVDGAVATTEYARNALGLRAIDRVGERRAGALREAGYPDRETLADADVATVADRTGLGSRTAARVVRRARAFRSGRVLRTGDGSLPRLEPVFLDVETDGLSPSIAWLLGVLDPSGDEETYMSFLTRDPDEPGEALSAFCTWYAANAANRPIVAYNGLSFDFPVLERLVERHCPEHRDVWDDAWTFDPLAWAKDGNAVLPGRTNRLGDVAAALEFDRESAVDRTGTSGSAPLSGAVVARIYRSWMADPTPANEPDWEHLEAYCEADVRALAHVYDAIAAADRIESEADGRHSTETTTQGSLGEF